MHVMFMFTNVCNNIDHVSGKTNDTVNIIRISSKRSLNCNQTYVAWPSGMHYILNCDFRARLISRIENCWWAARQHDNLQKRTQRKPDAHDDEYPKTWSENIDIIHASLQHWIKKIVWTQQVDHLCDECIMADHTQTAQLFVQNYIRVNSRFAVFFPNQIIRSLKYFKFSKSYVTAQTKRSVATDKPYALYYWSTICVVYV